MYIYPDGCAAGRGVQNLIKTIHKKIKKSKRAGKMFDRQSKVFHFIQKTRSPTSTACMYTKRSRISSKRHKIMAGGRRLGWILFSFVK
jgi:hypothetical protein